MRKISVLVLLVCAICMSSPVLSKTKKTKIKSYEMPGTELILDQKSTNIRAWAVGTADTEPAARMMAMSNASAELAEMVSKSVESTLKKCVSLESTGGGASSQDLMLKELIILANQQLSGAIVIYDSWEPKNDEGMYKNYIVLELKGDKFIDQLYKDYEATTEIKRLNRKELEEAFFNRNK